MTYSGGNHVRQVGAEPGAGEGWVWLMPRSGSRNVGKDLPGRRVEAARP
jgi:hypothetical protein